MKIVFTKPIAFFDIESTGLDVAKDRIVSISIHKIHVNGEKIVHNILINPTILIPKEVSEVHGITDEHVKDCPAFKDVAQKLHQLIFDCDLAGYNSNNFDIPLLCEEFMRCNLEFPLPSTKFIDVGNIFKKKEERTLSAALKFYCDRDMVDAHNADADVAATYAVFCAQIEKYPELTGKTVDEIAEFSSFGKRVDFAGKIGIDADGDFIYNIGKAKGTKIKNDPGFGYWMLGKDFTLNTKAAVRKILTELESRQSTGGPF